MLKSKERHTWKKRYLGIMARKCTKGPTIAASFALEKKLAIKKPKGISETMKSQLGKFTKPSVRAYLVFPTVPAN